MAPVWGVAVVIGLYGIFQGQGDLQGWNRSGLIVHIVITPVAMVGLGLSFLRANQVGASPNFALGVFALIVLGDVLRRGEILFVLAYLAVAIVAITAGAVVYQLRLERAFEQVKLGFGHQDLGGVLVGSGGSYDISSAGRTHQAPGDVPLMDTLPGWTIHVPGHADEVEGALPPRVPAVLLNAHGSVRTHSSFGIDNWRGVREIVDHLWSTGRRNIVHIAGPGDNVDAQERRDAFIRELVPEYGEGWASKISVNSPP